MPKRKTKRAQIKDIQRNRIYFSRKNFNETVNWLDYYLKNVEENNPSDYIQDFNDILHAHERDLAKLGSFPSNCYKEIYSIFASAVNLGSNKFRTLLLDVYPYIQDWRVTQRNLVNISKIANISTMEPIARYYLYCFTYLIEIEGSYQNWMKILFYLLHNVVSGSIKLERIEEKYSLITIKDMMIARGIDSVLFEGYKDGKLRNAIAHGNFSYNMSEEKMLFKNIHKGVEKYSEEMTFDEFVINLHNVFFIPEICTEIIMLLGILDISLALANKAKKTESSRGVV